MCVIIKNITKQGLCLDNRKVNMASNKNKKRRAKAARASQIEHTKGTSKRDLFVARTPEKMSGKKKALIISLVAFFVAAIVMTVLFFTVFKKDDENPAVQTVTLQGAVYSYSSELGGWEVRAENKDVTTVTIPDSINGTPVVAIADDGFAGCTKLTTVLLPNTLQHVGASAFNGCTSLKFTEYSNAKYLGSSANPYLLLYTVRNHKDLTGFQTEAGTAFIYDYAFSELEYMTLVIITENIKEIGTGAFANSKKLASINIPSNVKSVGDYAFFGCSALSEVKFGGENPQIGAYAFASCPSLLNFYLPYGLTEISDGMLQNSGLYNIDLPNTLKRIGKRAFESNVNLASVYLPASLVSIDAYAFAGCGSIAISNGSAAEKTISLPNTLKHVGAYAFSGCFTKKVEKDKDGNPKKDIDGNEIYTVTGGVEVINIPASITDIGEGAFSKCENLQMFSMEKTSPLTRIPNNLLFGCKSLAYVALSDNIESIGEQAFRWTALQALPTTPNLKEIGVGALANCDSIRVLGIPDTVTSIGDNAFYETKNLTRVTLSKNLTAIGDGLFYQCTGLTSVTIPESVKSIGVDAFFGCTALEEVTLTYGLLHIEYGAFHGCEKLTLNQVPSTVFDLGYIPDSKIINAESLPQTEDLRFALGPNFTYTEYEGGRYAGTENNPYFILVELIDKSADTAEIHPDTKIIASGAFFNSKITSVTLPDGLLVIGEYAFAYCTYLTEMTIPDSVHTILNGAFYGASAMSTVSLGSGLLTIGDFAFMYCTALKNTVIPNGIEKLGTSIFYSCTSLESVTLPDTVTDIPTEMFRGCTNLTQIAFSNITSVGFDAFTYCNSLAYTTDGGVLYLGTEENPYLVLVEVKDTTVTTLTVKEGTKIIHSGAFYGCTKLISVTIPDTVTAIGSRAFSGCTALTSINLPAGISTLESGLFAGCTNLVSVTAPGVTSVDSMAFSMCKALTEIKLSAALKYIGDFAFAACTSLKTFYIPASVKSVGCNVFDGCTSLRTVKIGAAFEHSGFNYAWLDQSTQISFYPRVIRGV